MKAILLAGGFGKRLRPLTDTTPKPMLLIGEKPILQWQIEWLRRAGVDEFVLCIGYLKDKVIDHFGDGSQLGVHIAYALEDRPLGTAGALRNALAYFPKDESFFVLNGDVLGDVDLKQLRERREADRATGTIGLVPLPSPYGEVVTDAAGRVTAFREKPRLFDHWINGGMYCLHPAVAAYLPSTGSLEYDVFPALAAAARLTAVQFHEGAWLSVDSAKDLEDAQKMLASSPSPGI